jgi:hypothetical protein
MTSRVQAPAPGLRGAGHGRHVGARGALRRRRPPAPLPHLHEDLPLAAPHPPGSPAVAPLNVKLRISFKSKFARSDRGWRWRRGRPRAAAGRGSARGPWGQRAAHGQQRAVLARRPNKGERIKWFVLDPACLTGATNQLSGGPAGCSRIQSGTGRASMYPEQLLPVPV